MSTLKVDNFQSGYGQPTIPLSELKQRVINSYYSTYNSGSHTPTTTYNWVPGLWHDYTPVSASSRIRATLRISYSYQDAHAINHCIFYANGVELGRHCISGYHVEQRFLYVWDTASWGTTLGRIGYQARIYGTSNEGRFHGTGYWDGGGSNQNAMSEFRLDEYIPI